MSRDTGRSGQAWAAFFLENHRALTTYALSLTGNLADAEDLIQSALTNLLRSATRPRGAKPLVLACMRNLMIDRHRADARRPLLQSLAECGPAFLAADKGAADGEQIDRVRDALAGLSSAQREVIVLRIYSGLTFKETAQVLDEPIGTVTSRYARGLAELRTALEPETNHA